MPITFGCASCGKLMRVADALAGKSVRCPHCQAVMVAPDDIPVAPVVPPAPPPPPVPLEVEPPVPEPAAQDWAEATRRPRPLRKATPRQWEAFADACQTISVGIWIEFAAYVVVFLIVFYAGMTTGSRPRTGPPVVAQVLFAVFFVTLLIGSVFTAIGRFKMWTLPAGTGVGGVTTTAAVLSVVRIIMVLGSGVLLLVGLDDPSQDRAGGIGFLLLALTLGWLTDMAVLPAMGVIGGMVPGGRLRSAVGVMSVFVLLAIVGWIVALGVVGAFTDDAPYGRISSDPMPGRTTSSGRADPTTMLIVLGVGVVLFVVYTLLHQAVYQAGRADSRRPAAED